MRRVAVIAVLVFAGTASPASAETIGGMHQVRAAIPMKVDRHIGFIPVNTMGRLPSFRMYVSGGQYVRGPWVNFTITRDSMSQELGYMRRGVGNGMVTFTDRALKRSEKSRFTQVADFGRDADVIVVKRGHPACTTGLTMAQARGIASGRITNWSRVGATPADAPDRIAVRHVAVTPGYVEPRFGTGAKPKVGKGTRDGGISEAAVDGSVAGITAWSLARYRSDVCAVPLGGVPATNTTVHSLKFPGAFPVGIVAPRKVLRNGYHKRLITRFAKFFESEAAAKLMRRTGLLIKKDTPADSAPPGQGPVSQGPSRDSQGRAITSVRDDAGVTSALTGERIAPEGGGYHWALEAGSLLRYVQPGEPCSQSEGRWTVVEGYRYSEHGGGLIARVAFDIDGATNTVTLEMSNDAPGAAYMNGTPYSRSRDLPASC